MNTIYQTVISKVGDGAHCGVDFKKRTLRLDNKRVDLTAAPLGIEEFSSLDEWLDRVEDLYDAYKYSRPTKSSAARERRTKFKALSAKELVAECGHGALGNPLSRDVAQAALEVFILLSLVNGSFIPDELFAKDWFYQGGDKSFIMREDWF